MDECPITGKPCEHKKYIHITEVTPEYTCSKELHLCHECSGAIIDHEEYKKAIIDGLIQFACKKIKEDQELLARNCCPKCNHTIEDIERTSRLGCGECYNHFRKQLLPILEKIHNATQHIGKTPSNLLAKSREDLEAELKVAIESEDYDKAAKIRDMLK